MRYMGVVPRQACREVCTGPRVTFNTFTFRTPLPLHTCSLSLCLTLALFCEKSILGLSISMGKLLGWFDRCKWLCHARRGPLSTSHGVAVRFFADLLGLAQIGN